MPLPKGTKEAALIALLVADIALVYAVMRGSGAATTTTGPAPSTVVSTPTATGTATGGATALNTTAAMPVSVVDNNVAWRVLPGSCATPGAALAITTDGGATWKSVAATMRAVTRVTASSATSGFLVGATSSACRMVVQNTEDGGGSWIGGATGSTWRVELTDPTAVFSASGQTTKPCASNPVIGLQRTTDSAVTVLCADGTLKATSDGGATWPAAGKVGGALALGVAGSGGAQRVIVAAKSAACPGVTVQTRVGAGTGAFSAPACVDVGAVAADTSVGVGIGGGGTARPWLFVGSTTWRGSADLKTWQKVS